jgi:hypothetical protein
MTCSDRVDYSDLLGKDCLLSFPDIVAARGAVSFDDAINVSTPAFQTSWYLQEAVG